MLTFLQNPVLPVKKIRRYRGKAVDNKGFYVTFGAMPGNN
jgi:hypothetical protein